MRFTGRTADDLEESLNGGGVDSRGGMDCFARLDRGGGAECRDFYGVGAARIFFSRRSDRAPRTPRLDNFLCAGDFVFGLAAHRGAARGFWGIQRADRAAVDGGTDFPPRRRGNFSFCDRHRGDHHVQQATVGGNLAGGGNQHQRVAAGSVSVDLCRAARWLGRIWTLAFAFCVSDYLGWGYRRLFRGKGFWPPLAGAASLTQENLGRQFRGTRGFDRRGRSV